MEREKNVFYFNDFGMFVIFLSEQDLTNSFQNRKQVHTLLFKKNLLFEKYYFLLLNIVFLLIIHGLRNTQ